MSDQSRQLGEGERVRRYLLLRCEDYCRRTGTAESTLSVALANASNFISRLRKGSTTLAMVDRVTAKLDALEAVWAAEHPEGEPDGETEAKQTPDGSKRHRAANEAVP